MEYLINEINLLRAKYPAIPENYNDEFFNNVMNSITESEVLAHHPHALNLVKDLEQCIAEKKILLNHTKNNINSGNNDFIFSVFKASYFPELKIEACFYENLAVNPSLNEKYKTNVKAVNIKKATDGFHSRIVVALFPENHIDAIQLECDSIFYFMNKFIARFFNITHKMISSIIDNDFFMPLCNASDEDIREASIYWVFLHEYHHRQGFLPIPKYLPIKSIKPLAGLEEMRVDVLSIITCMEDSDLPKEKTALAAKFIFAERLLRYAVEGALRPNYDAIASQLLFNFLKSHGGLTIDDMKIRLTNQWFEVLKELSAEIENIEAQIQYKSENEVQLDLLNFTKQYTNFNEESQDFNHIQYFKKVKEMYHL